MESIIDRDCNICKNLIPDPLFIAHQLLHSEDKFHPCEVCGIVFTNRDDLTKHKYENCKRIAREKPYKCDVCKKTFSRNDTLYAHKRIHTEEKSYECDVCKKAFTHNNTLTYHKRIHTGEKPPECDICKKTFISNSAYNKHKKGVRHLKQMESQNLNTTCLVDCGKSIKLERIKEEIKEEENVNDPLSIQMKTTKNGNIVTEVKTEVIQDDSLCVPEIHNSGDGDNNIVFNDIDIVEHKIKDSLQNNAHEVNNLINDLNVDDIVEEVNHVMDEMEENVVGQGNIYYQVLENLSVAEALAFFSS